MKIGRLIIQVTESVHMTARRTKKNTRLHFTVEKIPQVIFAFEKKS